MKIIKTNLRKIKRVARHERIRKNLVGTTERPRLAVSRSLNNMSAQIIDDITHKVIVGVSTLNKDLRKKLKSGGNVEAATALGEAIAALAQKKGIKKVSFDRGGYLYHGRIKAVAEAARKGGLEF
jgi:large subunit ribosomal protein L18